ncbi:hypothetical protein VNO77_16140 [Canavalia gladiata]|uniref:Uncharacterized protein n=1 Tax=Canavalia gladiata TaxID=3824 RepID=A0AAN9M183_CANGL
MEESERREIIHRLDADGVVAVDVGAKWGFPGSGKMSLDPLIWLGFNGGSCGGSASCMVALEDIHRAFDKSEA